MDAWGNDLTKEQITEWEDNHRLRRKEVVRCWSCNAPSGHLHTWECRAGVSIHEHKRKQEARMATKEGNVRGGVRANCVEHPNYVSKAAPYTACEPCWVMWGTVRGNGNLDAWGAQVIDEGKLVLTDVEPDLYTGPPARFGKGDD